MPYNPERQEAEDDLEVSEPRTVEEDLNERFALQRDLERYEREIKRASDSLASSTLSESEKELAAKRKASLEKRLAQTKGDIEFLDEILPDKKKLN